MKEGLSPEEAIAQAEQTLRARINDTPEGRAAAVMLDIMPGFTRAYTRERARFFASRGAANITVDTTVDVTPKDVEAFLALFSVTISNMVASLLLGMAGEHKPGECAGCDHNREQFLIEMLETVYACVMDRMGRHAAGVEPENVIGIQMGKKTRHHA